jgi:predicted Zn finger-like uncharacterized protein
MDVRCEQCKTLYELDDARVSEAGTTVRCTTCGHVFRVRKKVLLMTEAVPPGGETTAVPPPVADKSAQWRVRSPSGKVVAFRELTSLQKWIVERKFGRNDQISLRGDTWKRLGDIAELQPFFVLLDEVDRVRELEARLNRAELPDEAQPLLERELVAPAATGAPIPTPIRLETAIEPPLPEPLEEPTTPHPTPVFTAPAFSLDEIREATQPQPDDQPMPPGPLEPSGTTDPDRPEFTRRAGLGVNPGLVTDEDGWEPQKPARSKAPIIATLLLLAAAGAAVAAYFQVWIPAQREQKRLDAERDRVDREQMTRNQRESELRERERRAKEELVAGLGRTDGGAAPDGGGPSGAILPSPPRGELGSEGQPAGSPNGGPSTPTSLTSRPSAAPGPKPRPVRVAEARPGSFQGWMARGDREHENQRLTAALGAYDRAVEVEPSRPEAHLSRGVVLLELGNREAATAAFQRALELNPRYAVAQYWLGEAYRRSGRKSDAIRAFGRYLELSPEGEEAGAARRALQLLQE